MERVRLESNVNYFRSRLKIPDFDMLMMMAIGSRHILHEDIACIYKEDKNYYYELYRKSPYYQDKRLKSLSVQNSQPIQQFAGIYLHEQSLHTNELIMKFIKKGYRFVFRFVKNHAKIDFYQLRDDYIKYVKKNAFEKNIHSAYLFGVALYLCDQFNKTIVYDDFDIKLIRESIEQSFLEIETHPELLPETDDFLEQYKPIGMTKRDFNLPLKDLVVAMNTIHKQQIAEEKNMNFQKEIEQLNAQIIEHDFYKGLSKIALILQFCNINPLDIQNITNIEQSKMKELISLVFSSIEILDLSEDVHSLLGAYLLIYALATDYNYTKHHLIVTTQEETHHELLNLKREYESKIKLLQAEEDHKNAQIKHLTESNQALQGAIQDLEKHLKKSERTIQEQEEEIGKLIRENEELLKWKNAALAPKEIDLAEEEMAEVINDNKIVIVGGIKSWQDSLKGYLPTARFIQPEELNIDLDFLLKADLVFFNETVNNHSMYQKIRAKLENTNIPLLYSGGNTNIKISLRRMYDFLSS